MKIYISGPMRGVPDLNFPEFHHHAARLRRQNHYVFNPAEVVVVDGNFDRLGFAEELAWICEEADAIFLLDGWENSDGARAEKAVADVLHLQIMHQTEKEDD